jgi:hypothetical protein
MEVGGDLRVAATSEGQDNGEGASLCVHQQQRW